VHPVKTPYYSDSEQNYTDPFTALIQAIKEIAP
jgi:hypothetical protein